jgi:uncharacterized protein (DUF302 family)
MAPAMPTGLVSLLGNPDVDATVEKLKSILLASKITLFAVVDHSGEAEKAGLQMRNTKLVIFGSPLLGTPLMVAAPTAALDLPLKILVYEDGDGRTWIAYNDPEYLRERHGFTRELMANIAGIAKIAGKIADRGAPADNSF